MKVVTNFILSLMIILCFACKKQPNIQGYWLCEDNQKTLIIDDKNIQLIHVDNIYSVYRSKEDNNNGIVKIDSPIVMNIKYKLADSLYFYENDSDNNDYDKFLANKSFVNIYENDFDNHWGSLKVNFLIQVNAKTVGKYYELILYKNGNTKFAKGSTVKGYPKLNSCVLPTNFKEISKISNSNYYL